MSCPHIWSSDEGTQGCELAGVTAKQWHQRRDAMTKALSAAKDGYHGRITAFKACEKIKQILSAALEKTDSNDGMMIR